MFEVIFVNPPLTMEERYGKLAEGGSKLPPLNLALLAAITRNKKYSTRIIDAAALEWDYEKTANEIIKMFPMFVGITAVTMSIYNADTLADKIKKLNPNIFICVGGPHISAVPEDTMALFPNFDCGVIGEGDVTVLELLNKLKGKIDIIEVEGIITRKDGNIIKTKPRTILSDIDSLPFPAWDLLPDLTTLYKPASNAYFQLPSSSLITSRGCPGKCTFCDRTVSGNRMRSYSAVYLINMIKELYFKYGIKDIIFHDDNFIAHRERMLEFCKLLIEEKLNITWSCTGRIDMVNPEVLKMMKKAGCWQIAYGIESGAQKILDSLKKGITIDEIRKVLNWTKEAKIESRGYFMIGVPGETKETIDETIKFLLELPLDDFHISVFTPHPGAEIVKDINLYGTFKNDWKKDSGWDINFIPNGLTEEELIKYHKLAFRKFYFRPKIFLRYLKKIFKRPETLLRLLNGGKALIKYIFS